MSDYIHDTIRYLKQSSPAQTEFYQAAEEVLSQGRNLPFYRRLPFMRGQGFTPLGRIDYNEVNLDQLAESFKTGAQVTPEALASAHLLRDPRNPDVILGRGDVNIALKVRAHRITAGAKAKIEKAGGSVELIGCNLER